jgi:Trk K+ transport system NAD-binding subunit
MLVMLHLPRPYRRLLVLILALPATLFVLAVLYQAGMQYFEGQTRSLLASLKWAAEALTTTGYGGDTAWTHPVMQFYVIAVQFIGVFLVLLVFPIFFIPFFEERFETRLPTRLPDLKGSVLIYRYGPAVSSLLLELDQAQVPVAIFEEDEAVARRLRERGRLVVLGNLREEDPDLSNLAGARGMILNGDDNDNALMTLAARHSGFTGPIVALAGDPSRSPPLIRAGATVAFTPDHVLAAALAARASRKISPRVAGVHRFSQHLEVAELRLHAGSPLAGATIRNTGIRTQTGATIVGMWVGGELVRQPPVDTLLEPGSILIVVGSQKAIDRLGEVATAAPRRGPFLLIGHSQLGEKVTELLRDAGEDVLVLDTKPADEVDVVGDLLDTKVLEASGASTAQAVILTLDTDSATIFATAVVRSLSPDAVIIAGTRRVETVSRIYRAGADFALSVSQVSGQLLTYHILGQESVSLEIATKLVATSGVSLTGRPLKAFGIRNHTGCLVVAVERNDQVMVEFDLDFEVRPDDTVYITGTPDGISKYFKHFPDAGLKPAAKPDEQPNS